VSTFYLFVIALYHESKTFVNPMFGLRTVRRGKDAANNNRMAEVWCAAGSTTPRASLDAMTRARQCHLARVMVCLSLLNVDRYLCTL